MDSFLKMTKWKYKDVFINSYCAVKVYTTSRRIHDLIKKRLDFSGTRESKPDIEISFYIDEANDKNLSDDRDFVYRSFFDYDKNLSLALGSCIARVTADSQKQTVKGTVINYRERHKERLFDLIFFQPLCFILSHQGLFYLHASMVSMGRDRLLITGPQNCGKSIVSLILAQGGFSLLSDDDCFIKLRGKQIQTFPFPTKMGLNDKILSRYPEFNSHTLRGYRYGGKKRLSLHCVSNQSGSERSRCIAIIFPAYKAGCKNVRLREIPSEESLNRLAKEYRILGKKEYERMFWVLYLLTKNARSFELAYNDNILNEIPGAVKEIL